MRDHESSPGRADEDSESTGADRVPPQTAEQMLERYKELIPGMRWGAGRELREREIREALQGLSLDEAEDFVLGLAVMCTGEEILDLRLEIEAVRADAMLPPEEKEPRTAPLLTLAAQFETHAMKLAQVRAKVARARDQLRRSPAQQKHEPLTVLHRREKHSA